MFVAEIALIRTIGLCWIYFVFTTKPLLPADDTVVCTQSVVIFPAADKRNLHTPHTKIPDNIISDIKKRALTVFGVYRAENDVRFLKTSFCVPNESFRLSYNKHYKYVSYSSSCACRELVGRPFFAITARGKLLGRRSSTTDEPESKTFWKLVNQCKMPTKETVTFQNYGYKITTCRLLFLLLLFDVLYDRLL